MENERFLEPFEAFEDFVAWIKQRERWAQVPHSGKDRITKAIRALKTGEPSPLGEKAIASLIELYGGDRYERISGYVVNGE